jgi:ribosomal protein S12 methylthiotransferase RimO
MDSPLTAGFARDLPVINGLAWRSHYRLTGNLGGVSVSENPDGQRVALLTLGCARNEVDSEELAARLTRDGWQVSGDGTGADVVVVNTCGFVAKAKQDSIETLLAAADTGAKVVAAGCMAERYGRELAGSLPEADAVLSFDDYPDISARLSAVLAGEKLAAHTPRDRRELLPLTPVARRDAAVSIPGHLPAHLKTVLRHRLDSGPVASLKLASGCDRRCAFCAIPAFRGAFVSRTPDELLAEAAWLADRGVRELVLVSENSTSYGKDLGDPRLLEKLLPQLAATAGIARVRVSYLQPAETRPGLVEAIATTPGVAAYFDLSFQHASEPLLRRMRRFGSTDRFLDLLASVRELAPEAGARSNVIVGFPGETRADVTELVRFLSAARLDAIGVFDYSDEDGTEAAAMSGKVARATIARRYAKISALVDELCAQRAEERIGSTVEVLVDSVAGGVVEGRAAHQAPEVDGSTTLTGGSSTDLEALHPGDLVRAVVTGSEGVDLVAVPVSLISAGGGRAAPDSGSQAALDSGSRAGSGSGGQVAPAGGAALAAPR